MCAIFFEETNKNYSEKIEIFIQIISPLASIEEGKRKSKYRFSKMRIHIGLQ